MLDAVINEALRLHPAAPASLPRITPKGGYELGGYRIPENVSAFESPAGVKFTEQSRETDHCLRTVLYYTARSFRVPQSRAF